MPDTLTAVGDPDQLQREFEENGYIILRQLLDDQETAALRRILESGSDGAEPIYGKRDASGKETRLSVHNSLDDSPPSAIVRGRRIVKTMECLLRDEVYHYHHKLMVKQPLTGGAWEWHQDYGYWYYNGCLYPDMASCLIAISPADKSNGCLQVIPGSHRFGRIDHRHVGDQYQADPDRVAVAVEKNGLFFCELSPGDAIFFHANLLHRSDANTSQRPRLSLICCYNTRHNDPVGSDNRHPNYSPLEIWSDQRVKQAVVQGPAGNGLGEREA